MKKSDFKKLEDRVEKWGLNKEVLESKNERLNRMLRVEIPNGKEVQPITFYEQDEEMKFILGSTFEQHRFIRGYEGIWSEDKKSIECELSSNILPNRFFFKRLRFHLKYGVENNENSLLSANEDKEDDSSDIIVAKTNGITVSIGECSDDFVVLFRAKEKRYFPFKDLQKQYVTIKIDGIKISTHEEALNQLHKFSNSILFQIDQLFSNTISLVNERENIIDIQKEIDKSIQLNRFDALDTIQLKYEYDHEPMALYWYAKKAKLMLLFQYLAYYQVIEYYFPFYSTKEAKNKIQNLLKDPKFNANRDKDIVQLLSAIKISANKGIGNEREQLLASISACLSNEDCFTFFSADKERLIFYSSKQWKNISDCRITVKDEKSDFVQQATDRIYDIRNKIVHKKADENNFDVILPFSAGIQYIKFDIQMVEFIARKMLIERSTAFRV